MTQNDSNGLLNSINKRLEEEPARIGIQCNAGYMLRAREVKKHNITI